MFAHKNKAISTLQLMLSLRQYSTATRAVRPSMLLKCVAARYGRNFVANAAFNVAPKSQARQTGQLRCFSPTSTVSWKNKDREYFSTHSDDFLHLDHHDPQSSSASPLKYEIPFNIRQKVVDAKDAVALVRDGDTVCISGFVCQGAPEAVLKALGQKYKKEGTPNNLTLLFGGGPGDWESRGLNHLAKEKDGHPPMLRRTIGGHYGQVPMVAQLALDEKIEAWTLPMGSVSRMIRAQSTHSPGHITSVGIGTYVDPEISGGAANEKATKSKLHDKLVTRIAIDDQIHLMYKALPIDVAIIRGTTADAAGNITVEEESLLADQKIMAAAAKNSGGIVIAQVKRLAAKGSLPSRQVAVPGPLVDCVVVVDEKDHDTLHGMSFEERHNPALTGELVTPRDEILPMKLDIRKVIARRAFFALKPDKIVNLGIGMPEGVASVAAEEGMLDFVTLSTEPGSFGGLPASGKSFGPAFNASALVEMNQMFDFYDGGGLHICFLGAAQISPSGDVNVSRMAKNRLTGPGGFIDISQSTRDICFMTTLTAKGLEVSCPGDGSLKIDQEGKVKKFVPEVFEKTFSGDEAVRRGQKVFYVTERAVFRRTAKNDVIELIEVAEGVDVQKDVIDQMEFTPAISPNLKKMDPRIFKEEKMNVTAELFGSLEERCSYQKEDHTMFLDLFGINLNTKDDVDWFFDTLSCILEPLVRAKGPIDMVVQYDGFDIRQGLEDEHIRRTKELEDKYYKSVHRFTGTQFHRAKLAKKLKMSDWDPDSLYDEFDTNKDGSVSLEELRHGVKEFFEIRLSPTQLALFQKTPESTSVDRETFAKAVENLLKME